MEGFESELFKDFKKDFIDNKFDWLVENVLLTNFKKIQISSNITQDQIQDLEPYLKESGLDFTAHIIGILKSEMYTSIINAILKELFNTNITDHIDLTASGLKNSIFLDYKDGRKVCDKVLENSYKNLVTNGSVAALLQDCSSFITNSLHWKNAGSSMYPIGSLDKIISYVDPYMKYTDDRICLFDEVQINIGFIKINIITESTMTPKLLLECEMDFYIPSPSKLIYILTDRNSDNYRHIISMNRDIKIDKLLNE